MGRLARIWQHRLWDETDTRDALPAEAMARIEADILASEQGHSGEIRICVEASLPLSYLWKELSARDRAIMMFSKLRVWDTEANNGVLIYLLLAEHAIEIVADRGLNHAVETPQWQAVVAHMKQAFRDGQFESGLRNAVREVDGMLRRRFPLQAGQRNPNELPDKPFLL